MKSINDPRQWHAEPFWMVRQATVGTVVEGMVGEMNCRMSRLELGLSNVLERPKEVAAVLRGLGAVVAITGMDQGVPVMASVPRVWQEAAAASPKPWPTEQGVTESNHDIAQTCNLLPRLRDGSPIRYAPPTQSTPGGIDTVPNAIRRYSRLEISSVRLCATPRSIDPYFH